MGGKELREDFSKISPFIVYGNHNRFCSVDGKWENTSFKGHTTVTDHYLEFYALIFIMISMYILKVKKRHLNELCSTKSLSQADTVRKLYRTGTKRLNRGNVILQRRRDNCSFCALSISILNTFLKCKKLQDNSHSPIIGSLYETLQIRETSNHKSETG